MNILKGCERYLRVHMIYKPFEAREEEKSFELNGKQFEVPNTSYHNVKCIKSYLKGTSIKKLMIDLDKNG